MTEAEALALAEKRNKHKGRALIDKEWRADHSAEKGWHVHLVDSVDAMWRDAETKRIEALRLLAQGDLRCFDAADEALLARVRAQLAGYTPETNQ